MACVKDPVYLQFDQEKDVDAWVGALSRAMAARTAALDVADVSDDQLVEAISVC